MNVLYLKTFDNGKLYIGITNNFKSRMSAHECSSKTENTKLYRAMRKHTHITEILTEVKEYERLKELEILAIQNFKDLGYELYNTTNGGDGNLGGKQWIGKHHTNETKDKMSKSNTGKVFTTEHKLNISKAKKGKISITRKPISYYETVPVKKSHFKSKCKVMGLDYNSFEETYTGIKDKSSVKFYTYKEVISHEN